MFDVRFYDNIILSSCSIYSGSQRRPIEQVDSAFHLSQDGKMSTGESQAKVGRITSVIPYDKWSLESIRPRGLYWRRCAIQIGV